MVPYKGSAFYKKSIFSNGYERYVFDARFPATSGYL